MSAGARPFGKAALLFCATILAALDAPAGIPAEGGRSACVCDPGPLRKIAILPRGDLMGNTVSADAISDTAALLAEGFPGTTVGFDGKDAQVRIVLRLSGTRAGSGRERPPVARRDASLRYPDHGYSWSSRCDRGVIVLILRSASPEGIGFGLYGLLQERLGFRFYHPKRSIIPAHGRWPLPASFRWDARPRFEKKGFPLHTLHPIELTEPIHDPAHPGAFEDVKAYIDWLARNQQNLFQFFLLRTVDRDRWPAHAARIVRYAHRRGLLAGVEVSLFMLQQNAFRLVHLPGILRPFRLKADASLAWLFQAPWDFVTVDFTMGEYMPDLGALMPGLRDHVVDRVTKDYGAKLMFTTHVIRRPDRLPAERIAGGSTGILIHTVMCYTLSEPSAPAYGNRDFRWLLDRARAEIPRQETWYWPESSYWIAFDIPVPILLLPYLDARLADMATAEAIGAKGHLTFTSGWEWGYWLVDWSIARWSWRHADDGVVRPQGPLEYIRELMPGEAAGGLWEQALALQHHYLKEKGLLAYVSSLDPSAELPWPFNKPFQPRPPVTASWLLHDASDAEARQTAEGPIRLLEEYAEKMESLTERMGEAIDASDREPAGTAILRTELVRSLEITALRARHRALTLKALAAQRGKPRRWQPLTEETKRLLKRAEAVRMEALALVRLQERLYRFPAERIARAGKGHTSYGFGYLYPASNLHFWSREEEQARRRRFDAFFMNIWDFPEITGAASLVGLPP